MGNINIERSEQ